MGLLHIMSWAGKFHKKPYLEQFERIKRWHKILNEIRVSNSSEDEADYQVDCIYAFFINCYHLKDWLLHSKVVDKSKINGFIKKNKEMKICRDICNGIKHLSLTNPSIGHNIKCDCGWHGVTLHREYDSFQEVLKNANPLQNATYTVLADFEKFNVFELADRCVELWKNFMEDNSLI